MRPRNGPPLAVIVSRSTAPGGWPAISWCSAVCSESTGTIRAPVASASAVTSSPPTTSDSLLASARSMPSPSAATVGPSPAEPTSAFRTRSALGLDDEPHEPLGAASTCPSVHASAGARGRVARRPARSARTPCVRGLLDELLPGALGGQPDELELVAARADVERLRADRARSSRGSAGACARPQALPSGGADGARTQIVARCCCGEHRPDHRPPSAVSVAGAQAGYWLGDL